MEIAARFSSEVAERLDVGGEKLRRGFLDWLGVQGEAARPARMPVVFKLADAAQEPVLASPPIRMQVDADGTSVVFEAETETDLRLVPGRLDVIVGVDADKDALYFPPPAERSQAIEQCHAVAAASSLRQLRSNAARTDSGSEGMAIEPRPALSNRWSTAASYIYPRSNRPDIVKFVRWKCSPFDGVTRDRQEHALYISPTTSQLEPPQPRCHRAGPGRWGSVILGQTEKIDDRLAEL